MLGGIAGVTNYTDNEAFIETVRTYMKDKSKIVAAHSTSSIEIIKNNDMLDGIEEMTCHPRLFFTFEHEEYEKETICREDLAVCHSGNLITS